MDLHFLQGKILKLLMYSNELNFADFSELDIESELLAYHLRMLQEQKLITKTATKTYSITSKGKQLMANYQEDFGTFTKRALLSVLVVIEHGDNYLLVERKKAPFKSTLSFIAGKVRSNESITQAAKRVTLEESNLTIEASKFVGFINQRLQLKGELLKQNNFCVIKVTQFNGLTSETEKSNPLWIKKDELHLIENKAYDLIDVARFVESEEGFVENNYEVDENLW